MRLGSEISSWIPPRPSVQPCPSCRWRGRQRSITAATDQHPHSVHPPRRRPGAPRARPAAPTALSRGMFRSNRGDRRGLAGCSAPPARPPSVPSFTPASMPASRRRRRAPHGSPRVGRRCPVYDGEGPRTRPLQSCPSALGRRPWSPGGGWATDPAPCHVGVLEYRVRRRCLERSERGHPDGTEVPEVTGRDGATMPLGRGGDHRGRRAGRLARTACPTRRVADTPRRLRGARQRPRGVEMQERPQPLRHPPGLPPAPGLRLSAMVMTAG